MDKSLEDLNAAFQQALMGYSISGSLKNRAHAMESWLRLERANAAAGNPPLRAPWSTDDSPCDGSPAAMARFTRANSPAPAPAEDDEEADD